MRRYQRLGLARQAERRAEASRKSGVGKFVYESRAKQNLLVNGLQRRHPQQSFRLPHDEVDWQLEYFFDLLGSYLKRFFAWLIALWRNVYDAISGVIKWMSRWGKCDSNNVDNNEFYDSDDKLVPKKTDLQSSTAGSLDSGPSLNLQPSSTTPEKWTFSCIPYKKRKILKRKWFRNPQTKQWANQRVRMFQQQIGQGFRRLCSSIGKDTKIQVGSHVFLGDFVVLQAQSNLLRQWFSVSQNNMEFSTDCVAPEEMEALLVYMYTLTWSENMMRRDPDTDKVRKLKSKFSVICEIYGIPMSLTKEHPFGNIVGCIDRLDPEDILCDSIFHPMIYKYLTRTVDGDGDFFNFNDFHNFKYYPKPICRSPSVDLHEDKDTSIERNVVRDALRISPEPRVHPESILKIVNEQKMSLTRDWVASLPESNVQPTDDEFYDRNLYNFH